MYNGTYLHYSFHFFKAIIDSKGGCSLISNLLKENKQVIVQVSEVLERSKEAKNTLCTYLYTSHTILVNKDSLVGWNLWACREDFRRKFFNSENMVYLYQRCIYFSRCYNTSL
jgi:hypothetical protein